MNTQQAKFILQGYRPNGADAGDAVFGEALAQTRSDAGLREWFVREQAFDGLISDKLGAVQAPGGLREGILAGVRVSASKEPRRAWWRQPAWMTMAASLVLVFSVIGLWTNRASAAADTLPEFAADYVAGGFFLSQHSADLGELRAWLGRNKAPLPTQVPAGFTQLRSLGCKTLDYRGKKVSLICFGQGKEYHLFVARREDFPAMAATVGPRYLEHKGYATAAWSDDQHHYVVVTDDSLQALKQCLNRNGS